MSKRNTFPTDQTWLLEAGERVDHPHPIEHSLGDQIRDTLEQMHSLQCKEDLCHPSCDFTLLTAHYYERLSVRDMAERYGFGHPGSISHRLDKARERFKEALILQIGYDPYE